MRPFLMAGNWKMNMAPKQTTLFFETLDVECQKSYDRVQAAICPPFVSIAAAFESRHSGSAVCIGAQNIHFETKGAYTGEVSAAMVKEMGCHYVILGHSERREYFAETDEIVNKKVKTALSVGIIPIVCVGEVLDERKQDRHFEVVKQQITGSLAGLSADEVKELVIAYEPVWAIGTGEVATPDQAQEMHAFIRSELTALFGQDAADVVRILYGGSMKPSNAGELLGQTDVDGGLIGGASLDPVDFAELVSIAVQQTS